MALWKVELYGGRDDTDPIAWGVVVAPSQDAAAEIAKKNMGSAIRAEVTKTQIQEIKSLPEGTFFWSESNA